MSNLHKKQNKWLNNNNVPIEIYNRPNVPMISIGSSGHEQTRVGNITGMQFNIFSKAVIGHGMTE